MSLPPSSVSTGNFSNYHWAELERGNKVPIIVYQLVGKNEIVKDHQGRKKTKKNKSVLHCIRTSPATLKL